MADIIVRRTERLSGEIYAPPSKAYTQRILIAALLSQGISKISNPLISDDTITTLQAVKAFGAKVKMYEKSWQVKGTQSLKKPKAPINCRESGATLRFLIPIATQAPGPSVFTLGQSLRKRPIKPLLESLRQLRATVSFEKNNIQVKGDGIKGKKTTIRGDVSSQFISGLLFACPMAKENTVITLTTPLESKTYVQMTVEILNKHGIQVCPTTDLRQFHVPSKQKYNPFNHKTPGDFSSAAFVLAAAAITSSKVQIKNLDYSITQGDKAIVAILRNIGLDVKVDADHVEVDGEEKLLKAVNVNAKDMPDLVPVCAAIACYSKGISKIYNAKRLRFKESDRLLSLYVELKKMGADITMDKDSLTVKGPCAMQGNIIDTHNDHRIAMACTIAALGANGETRIQNFECVKKSYPTFFDDLRTLGAEIVG